MPKNLQNGVKTKELQQFILKGLTKPLFNGIIKKNKGEIQMGKKRKENRQEFKMEGEELQQYLHFKKRGSVVENKKGKGSYKRHAKHKGKSLE